MHKSGGRAREDRDLKWLMTEGSHRICNQRVGGEMKETLLCTIALVQTCSSRLGAAGACVPVAGRAFARHYTGLEQQSTFCC